VKHNVRVAVLLLAVLSVAHGYLKSYEVQPVQASWSRWTRSEFPNNVISQTFTCNFDSIV